MDSSIFLPRVYKLRELPYRKKGFLSYLISFLPCPLCFQWYFNALIPNPQGKEKDNKEIQIAD